MEKKILKELLKRPGMSEQDWELLEDMIHDSIIDMRSYLNYEDEESLPEGGNSGCKRTDADPF